MHGGSTWEKRWRFDPANPAHRISHACGRIFTPEFRCDACGEIVTARDVFAEDGPGAGCEPAPPPRMQRRSIVAGDVVFLFLGGFLAWAVLARISLKRRPGAAVPAAMPFGRNDVIAIALGLAAYVAMIFWLHPWLIGVSVLGR